MKTRYYKQPLSLLLLISGLIAWSGCTSHAETLAYWRFEGGTAGQRTGVGNKVVPDTAGKDNTLSPLKADATPVYTTDVPFPTAPQTGGKNEAAVEFNGNSDLVTRNQQLNTYNFSPTGSQAWTVELSIKPRILDSVNRWFGRDGTTTGEEKRGPLQIVTADLDGDQIFDIRLEILDGSNTFQDVISKAIYKTGRWHNIAATATATTLSLYVDQLDGQGYQLVGQKAINGALNNTPGSWALGRGWNGAPTDWSNGKIDEVRISNVALSPSQFLGISPTGQALLVPQVAAAQPVEPLKTPLFFAADPHVSVIGNQYWMYPTGQGGFGPRNPVFFAYSSPDRKTWTKHGPILQFKDVSWIYTDGEPNHHPWAPAIAVKDGKYYFYYSVGPQGRTPARIGVAVADSPAGPFQDKGAPLLTGGRGFEAIDAMAFQDPVTGKYYFYAGGSAGAKLRVFEMASSMMHFKQEIIVETPRNFTEGAFMHYRNGIYYLSYSHGGWRSPSYSVHYATAKAPTGPFEYRGAILVSDETRKGPGHHSFVQDPKTGEWFIIYHRWQHPAGGDPFKVAGRSVAIEPVSYSPTGEILPITMTNNDLPILQESASTTASTG